MRAVLGGLGVSPSECARLAAQARFHGTTFQAEVLASGQVSEPAYFAAMARAIGMQYARSIDPDRLFLDEGACMEMLGRGGDRIMAAGYLDGDGRLCKLIAPCQSGWDILRRRCGQDIRHRVSIVTPSALRKALLARFHRSLTRRARDALYEQQPEHSARHVMWPWQGYALGMLTGFLPVAMATVPTLMLFGLHLFLVTFFIACAALRTTAAISRPPARQPRISMLLSPDLPVYSVIVALYQEAEVVPDLLIGLSRLHWPRTKLEIKLVCEEDDLETIAAIQTHPLSRIVELVLVPPSLPRTKPKALAYALPLTRGELVVLYDAEDRPDSMQLVEAWQRFHASGRDLACLQAPLEIANRRAGLIANMFGFEYAALFRGLLPFLAHNELMLPLGGTSNHFRREVLEEVGGWDPYNVTEDADLGLRLARRGYRCETLSRPTREDGPEDFRSWHRQRVRWLKGWIMTWLVHMREPALLARQLPVLSFVVTQILFAGMVLSSLLHLVLILLLFGLGIQVAFDLPMELWQSYLVAFDVFSMLLGYGSFLLLGWIVLKPQDRHDFWKLCLFTPVYWTMLSWAAWCALFELWRRPHHWAKTPHRRARVF